VALHPTRHKTDISETFPQANLLAWGGKKTKPNTTTAHIHQSKEMYTNTKKLKPGSVAFYDIQPVNRAGLFSKEQISTAGDK